MKRHYKTAVSMGLSFAIAAIVGLVPARVAHSKLVTNVPSDISHEELKAVVIEDFENAQVADNAWKATSTPKAFTSADTEKKLKMKNPVPLLALKVINGGPNDMNVEEWSLTDQGKKKEKCLGVNFQFRYPGPNEVHILPPLEVDWKEKKPAYTYNPSTRQDEQERGIQLPGRSKGLSIWVHGRGHPYQFECWLKDHRGDVHILKFGSVNFVGWRPLKVFIPASVPQTYESYPQTRVTKIVRFVLRAEPQANAAELTEKTFFFFDQLKVLTDTFEVNFDGQNLHKSFEGEKGGDSEKKTTK